MKKNIFLLFFLTLFLACSNTDNSFTIEANEFLDGMDGHTFTGKGTEAGLEFKPNGQLIAICGAASGSVFSPKLPLWFINTKDDGSSSIEAIYQEYYAPEQYIGIVRSNKTLYRTAFSSDTNLAWGTLTEFASR
ncbi:MAG: hypothetical protein ACRCS8_04865 [Brevinema sp.]